MWRWLVGVILTATLATPASVVAQLQLCDMQLPGNDPRPLWRELAPPDGSGYPDYQNISTNLQILNSLKLLASLATRAAESLQQLSTEAGDPEAEGRCVCCLSSNCVLPEIHLNVLRKDCVASLCTALEATDYPLWLPTDLLKSPSNAARFALQYIEFLDKLQSLLNDFSQSQLYQTLQALGSDLNNLQQLIAMYLQYVDLLTEGYHLGGYSSERPNLHLCVGYGGHGAFAEMANLFGEVSIGSRYTSHNLSGEHRAQFRSGGFAVTAFGRTISILPGIEANLQMDGFKLWDGAKPFGIDLGIVGDATCAGGPGFRIADIDKYDLFHLIDSSTDLAPFDTSGDGCLQPGEFLIKDFYEARYRSAADGMLHTWPRVSFPYDWEEQNTAVLSAGLNLPLELTPIEKLIPPTGIPVFPGATLYPKLTLKAGAEWTHQVNTLRARLQEAINKHLPMVAHLGSDDFERPMHDLQAPDLSADDGALAHVQPRVAADLVFGIVLKRYLRLGITASLGVSTRVEPAAHGGVHDLNVALATALLNSNPPPGLPCDPIIEVEERTGCSNEFFEESTGEYTCETSEVTVFHCKEPEDDRKCTPETAAEDCPETKECVAEYGCHAHGYCERIFDVGPDKTEWTEDDTIGIEHDTTYDACFGNAVCADGAVNAGAPCEKDDDCFGPTQCVGGKNNGVPCMSGRECPEGECTAPTAPCVQFSPQGYFTYYDCLVRDEPVITGWQGPGCHPLTVGFPSACGCGGDADCVAGLETCMGGICVAGPLQPVTCTCDPGNPTACGNGRVCRDGACVLDCSANGAADCAAHQTCSNGTCANAYGIPFAEQLVWQVTHTPKPQHAVATYALSDVLASAILDAGLWIGLDLRFARKSYHFTILTLSDYWTLAAFNKSWYQAGLEARYQNDCDPVAGATVSNWQPGTQRVTRYNPLNASSGSYGNAGTLTDLQQWCLPELTNDVADPQPPDEGDLGTTVTDVVNWGEGIGVDVWALGGLCVRQRAGGQVTQAPLTEWLADLNANAASLQCTYTFNNQPFSFPCDELGNRLLLIWGCLDVTANPWAQVLAAGFPGSVTTFGNEQVFDLGTMLVDPDAEFTLDNLKPQIRTHGFNAGVFWFHEVTQCFEQHHAMVQPGDIQFGNVQLEPCCGNGILDNSGCAQGPGVPPCESCDDGNRAGGDGCTPLCRIEGRTRPFGACGNGILEHQDLEECDDGNLDGGDGCEADCTLTQATGSPSPTPTLTPRPSNTAPATVTPTRTRRVCVGDCNGRGDVTINELVTGVNIVLELVPVTTCTAFDRNADGRVTIDELVRAVSHALTRCPID